MANDGGEAPWAQPQAQAQVPWAGPGPQAQAVPVMPQTTSVSAPTAKIDRMAIWSMGLAIGSILLGLLACVPALILAYRAQAMARPYGITSADSRVRWAKRLAIAFTILWLIIVIAAVASSGSNSSNG